MTKQITLKGKTVLVELVKIQGLTDLHKCFRYSIKRGCTKQVMDSQTIRVWLNN